MSTKRYVLIVSHTRREDAQNAARQVTEQLQLAGIVPVFPQQELSELQAAELAGDSAKIQTAKDALEARRSWLTVVKQNQN